MTIKLGVREGGNLLDQRAFVVRLKKIQMGRGAEFRPQRLLEIGERGAAINLRLTFAEPVEIGAVEDRDLFHRKRSYSEAMKPGKSFPEALASRFLASESLRADSPFR